MPWDITSGQCLVRAGKGVSNEWISGAFIRTLDPRPISTLISGAMATINVLARNNFSADYSTLSADKKDILNDIAIDMVAIKLVAYDMNTSDSSRIEAEDIVNILRDSKLMGLSIIRDKKNQEFINAP